jgi:hypothetical protein
MLDFELSVAMMVFGMASERAIQELPLPRNSLVKQLAGVPARKRYRDNSTTVLVTQPFRTSDMQDYTIA